MQTAERRTCPRRFQSALAETPPHAFPGTLTAISPISTLPIRGSGFLPSGGEGAVNGPYYMASGPRALCDGGCR